ncbi:hypothetical protein DEO72_LG6g1329 [Vigna unguiculata]|uniref:Uncharacterized protein n=1 Tax=Vigna unguiculata TaxID=3917 RepID=A0A4D6M5Q2_VIGUN|nr:hypothetical protein DEO72_LG6g1329 [Vigna unguiculata]
MSEVLASLPGNGLYETSTLDPGAQQLERRTGNWRNSGTVGRTGSSTNIKRWNTKREVKTVGFRVTYIVQKVEREL